MAAILTLISTTSHVRYVRYVRRKSGIRVFKLDELGDLREVSFDSFPEDLREKLKRAVEEVQSELSKPRAISHIPLVFYAPQTRRTIIIQAIVTFIMLSTMFFLLYLHR